MTKPQVPQIPSRQSWSNAIGSSPFAHQPLVDDVEHLEERHVLGLTSGASYVTKRPSAVASFCRQTLRVMRIYL